MSTTTSDRQKQRFRGTTAASSSSTHAASSLLNAPASPSSANNNKRYFKPQSASSSATTTNATSINSQRVVALLQDVKRFIRHRQQARRDSGLPLHYKYHKQNAKAWHVDIPKRMLLSTVAVFLLLPLTIFYWKETHLSQQQQQAADVESKMSSSSNLPQSQHDVFPNWFSDTTLAESSSSQDEGDPNINNPQAINIADNNNNDDINNKETSTADADALAVAALDTNATTAELPQESLLNKLQFVNDTEIPDNDPLSDPETAPKVGGPAVAAAGSADAPLVAAEAATTDSNPDGVPGTDAAPGQG